MTDNGHYVKSAGSTYVPGCIVSVIVETRTDDRSTTDDISISVMQCVHVVESHRRGSHWSSPLYRCFFTGDDLFDWIESTRSEKHRTYVFSPCALDDLTLIDWHARIERIGCILTEGRSDSGPSVSDAAATVDPQSVGDALIGDRSHAPTDIYSIHAYIPGSNANIIRYSRFGRSVQWCSHVQYCQSSEDEIARQISYRWTSEQDDINQRGNQYHSCMERAHMWLSFYQRLSRWWYDIDGGPWGATIASMSYSFLRRRIDDHTILRHDNERAGELEQQAIFGGRRSVWYVGNIGSEDNWSHYGNAAPARSPYGQIDRDIVHHDIRSMYPYLLSRMQYPVRLIEHVSSMSVPDCIDALEHYGVIASVIVRTDESEYPYRTAQGIVYPTGQFRTALCGPELMRALSLGQIIKIDQCAIYQMGTPFQRACDELLSMREAARSDRHQTWELMTKMLANSMSGKIAQRQYEWVARHDVVPIHEWGPYHEWTDTDTAGRYYVARAGMVWERLSAQSSIRDMGAAYAYLTAYGRYYMTALRSMCPEGSVVAMDTDGIWCLDTASAYLYPDGITDRSRGGDIHWTTLSPVARFYGPQHYWAGHTWVISGSNVVSHRPKTDTIIVRTRHNLALTSPVTPSPEVMERLVQRDISRIHVHGEIDVHGYVTPPKVWTDLTE